MGQRFNCPHCGQQIKAIGEQARNTKPGEFQQVARFGDRPVRSGLVGSLWDMVIKGRRHVSQPVADFVRLEIWTPKKVVFGEVPATPAQLRGIAKVVIQSRRSWSRDNLTPRPVSQKKLARIAARFIELDFLVETSYRKRELTEAGRAYLSHYLSRRPSAF